MLRLSKLTDYGTVIMTCMARAPERVFSAAELAAAAGVGTPTAAKILKMLARAELVASLRGAKGGYLLARPAGAISIGQVIDALEGPVGMTECSVVAGLCLQERSCSIRENWRRINRVVREALDRISLADMGEPAFRPVDISALRAGPSGAGRQPLAEDMDGNQPTATR